VSVCLSGAEISGAAQVLFVMFSLILSFYLMSTPIKGPMRLISSERKRAQAERRKAAEPSKMQN